MTHVVAVTVTGAVEGYAISQVIELIAMLFISYTAFVSRGPYYGDLRHFCALSFEFGECVIGRCMVAQHMVGQLMQGIAHKLPIKCQLQSALTI
jgi:hypothetical protein